MHSSRTILRNNLNRKCLNILRHPRSTLAMPVQSTCPYIQTETAYQEKSTVIEYKPYTEVPGPKPIPVLGNTWR